MAEFKPNYLIIPSLTILVAFIGSSFTRSGMPWYHTLTLPTLVPPGWVFGIAWNIIYTLATIAAVYVWNFTTLEHKKTALLFGINGVLNAGWCWIFFGLHAIGFGIAVCATLCLWTAYMTAVLWQHKKIIAALLLPYVAWTTFATYLNYATWALNH